MPKIMLIKTILNHQMLGGVPHFNQNTDTNNQNKFGNNLKVFVVFNCKFSTLVP